VLPAAKTAAVMSRAASDLAARQGLGGQLRILILVDRIAMSVSG